MTPEGLTKKRLTKVLKTYGDDLYVFSPVQNGMGSPMLDFIICYKGYFASIETKAGKGEMTPRQRAVSEILKRAGAAVFLVNDVSGVDAVVEWLDGIDLRG